jgi:predicted ribosome quality control (RQC) complex YloA/Tae2 family protein
LTGGLTWAELARVASHLQTHLTGARLQKIRQPSDDAILLECRVPGASRWIWLSAHARFCRVVVADERPDRPMEASAFCMLLRKRLPGGVIDEIALDPADRVFTLRIVRQEGDEPVAHTLVAELFGPRSNLLLLDADGRVIGALADRRLASRGLQLGQPYQPPPRAGEPNRQDRGVPVEAMADAFADAEAAYEHDTRRARLLAAVAREQKHVAKYVEKLRRELSGLPDHERLTRHGELLLAHLSQVRKGQSRVRLPDWTDPDVLVEVELDPAKTPQDNANRLFKTARRTRRKHEDLQKRVRGLEDRSLDLEGIAASLRDAHELTQLAEVETRCRALGLFPAKTRQAPPRTRRDEPRGPQPFVAADGARIYVGRNAAQNEEITFVIARGNDYWLHVEGSPGSHVVVKLPPSGELGSETLLDAANLALLHSAQKSAGAGTIHYTRRKYVKKAKDAKAGQVYAAGLKSVFVRLDEARIQRLYQTREALPDGE